MEAKKPATPDEYINAFPAATQKALKSLRAAIKKAAPGADEGISYSMVGYKLGGPLVYFGGFKAHVSLFPTSSKLQPFEKELLPYHRSKGTIRFPLDKPLPIDLIRRIIAFRVKELAEKAAAKKASKKVATTKAVKNKTTG